MNHLVIGAGEVGTSLANVLDCPIRDLDDVILDNAPDVLHIAFGWSETFIEDVRGYEAAYEPLDLIVHSTVPVGTCDAEGWTHSPVRGRHPHLEDGLETFTKHVGGIRAHEAAQHFEALGIATLEHDRAATTEAGKLWELAMYGVEVASSKRIHEWCQVHGLSFDEVYGEFTETYNDGWTEMGQDRFVKPMLHWMPGPIGGHCIIENTPMLQESWIDELLAPYSSREGAPPGGVA